MVGCAFYGIIVGAVGTMTEEAIRNKAEERREREQQQKIQSADSSQDDGPGTEKSLAEKKAQ